MASYNSMPSRRLVSQEDSAQIENTQVPRSKFINQWTRKTAFNSGDLVPILVEEIYPGDHMTYNVTAFVRMATPVFPIMDNQRIDTFFFFVPSRVVWPNFVKMMGEQDNPGDSIAYQVPVMSGGAEFNVVGSIYDHMGLPTGNLTVAAIEVNALPFRCINEIYHEWFRDQNLLTAPARIRGDTGDVPSMYFLFKRCKPKDYFTSALTAPQKFTSPNVPLLGVAPIRGLGFSNNVTGSISGGHVVTETDNSSRVYVGSVSKAETVVLQAEAITGPNIRPAIYADLTQASGVSINQLRQAWLVQQMLEKDQRGGTRYVEKIREHFRVISPDYRLNRPEYIGGGQSPLQITPIAQTVPQPDATKPTPLGALGGAGTAAGSHHASYAATEHGYIIGFINVRTELSYQQGLPKMYSRRTQTDFYVPSLAGLGEQAILTKEIYCTGDAVSDNKVFGYQERWQELRTRQSEVTGIMRSTATGTLDQWHLAERFVSAPLLNGSFVQDLTPMSRVLSAGPTATANYQEYIADILYQRTAVRPVPTFGTPVTLGRF